PRIRPHQRPWSRAAELRNDPEHSRRHYLQNYCDPGNALSEGAYEHARKSGAVAPARRSSHPRDPDVQPDGLLSSERMSALGAPPADQMSSRFRMLSSGDLPNRADERVYHRVATVTVPGQ